MPLIIPIRYLTDISAVSQMCNESNEPIYITKNGYGDMVIMSMTAYEEKLWLLDTYAKIAEAEEDLKAGRLTDARSTLKELRERHGL